MILSNKDIEEYLKKKIIKISPFCKDQLGQASVDLSLSDEWAIFKKELYGKEIDLDKISFKKATKSLKADSILLKHGEMALAKTCEKITLPSYIMGKLSGRSRYARMGLFVHITSDLIQPGSNNHQVLEILNSAPFDIVLYKGMRISQVVFYELKNPTSKPYSKFGKIAKKQ